VDRHRSPRAGTEYKPSHSSRRISPQALNRQDPLRICFVNALDVVRGPVGQPGPFPPDRLNRLVTASLGVITVVTGRQRPGRSSPHQAKRSTSYQAKPADPGKPPEPRGPLILVMLPMPGPG
jgi:hypothetical protein